MNTTEGQPLDIEECADRLPPEGGDLELWLKWYGTQPIASLRIRRAWSDRSRS